LFAGLGDAIAPRTEEVAGDESRGAHHVDARTEDTDQLVDVGEHRVVHHTVRLERQQGLNIVGGLHIEGIDPAQLANIVPDLLRRPGIASDELQCRVCGYRPYRTLADVAGRPLNDSIRQRASPVESTPRPTMVGRSRKVRIPGAAAQTGAIACTACMAVPRQAWSVSSSSWTAIRDSSTIDGMPSTVTFQPRPFGQCGAWSGPRRVMCSTVRARRPS